MKALMLRLGCLFGFHDWTCDHDQGIKPDKIRMKQDPVGYFWEYARMYCSRCKTQSRLNRA